MYGFFKLLLKSVLKIHLTRKELVVKCLLLEKEVQILKRKLVGKRPKCSKWYKVIMSILALIGNVRDIRLVRPETILKWQKMLIKRFWTYERKRKVGRPAIGQEIRNLVLEMKSNNLIWGARRIQGELKKLGIELDAKTVRNIINDFHRKGKIRSTLSWKKFLEMHIGSIYAMDFFTVDTILKQRFYVFFIISHKTREIVQFVITQNPVKEFVRQQMIDLSEMIGRKIYMIRDNGSMLELNYSFYNIKDVKTSVRAPNMNAIAERFVGTIRREALDWFVILNEKQLRDILEEYIEYYNKRRPHQGLCQRIPLLSEDVQRGGGIYVKPVLSGLHHAYMRKAA